MELDDEGVFAGGDAGDDETEEDCALVADGEGGTVSPNFVGASVVVGVGLVVGDRVAGEPDPPVVGAVITVDEPDPPVVGDRVEDEPDPPVVGVVVEEDGPDPPVVGVVVEEDEPDPPVVGVVVEPDPPVVGVVVEEDEPDPPVVGLVVDEDEPDPPIVGVVVEEDEPDPPVVGVVVDVDEPDPPVVGVVVEDEPDPPVVGLVVVGDAPDPPVVGVRVIKDEGVGAPGVVAGAAGIDAEGDELGVMAGAGVTDGLGAEPENVIFLTVFWSGSQKMTLPTRSKPIPPGLVNVACMAGLPSP